MYLESPLKSAGRALAFAVIACAMLMGVTVAANAQTEPTLTFNAETVTGVESVTPRFTWSTEPEADSCAASGHPEWTGPKLPNGSADLSAVTQSAVFTLSCDWIGGRATLKWTPPTKNTDGSDFTNPAGVRIHYGRSSGVLSETLDVNDPSPPLSQYVVDGLAAGDWYFALRTLNEAGVESNLSNVVKKTVLPSATITRTISVIVNPKPAAVTDLSVE